MGQDGGATRFGNFALADTEEDLPANVLQIEEGRIQMPRMETVGPCRSQSTDRMNQLQGRKVSR
jgi:hypothetical protein